MRNLLDRLALFLTLASLLFAPALQARDFRDERNIVTIDATHLPAEAQRTLRLIQTGGPFPYPHRDGSVFGNFEKRLPVRIRGYYREYTVPTPGSRDRGARRIIAGEGQTGDVRSSGEYYYTNDHYRSFRRIRE